jgi:hypothetical protein
MSGPTRRWTVGLQELRFIVYAFPIVTVAAAVGCARMSVPRAPLRKRASVWVGSVA